MGPILGACLPSPPRQLSACPGSSVEESTRGCWGRDRCSRCWVRGRVSVPGSLCCPHQTCRGWVGLSTPAAETEPGSCAALGHPRRCGDLISSCPAASPPRGSPLLPAGAWGSARDPGATGAGPHGAPLSELRGFGVPEDLQVVPATLLQPFLVLLQADVAQAPADAAGPLAPVAGPLGKEEQGHGPKTSHRDHEVPPFTSSPCMNGAHCCSSTLYRIPACTVVAPSGRAPPRGWDPTSAGGSMAKSRSSPLPELPKPLG